MCARIKVANREVSKGKKLISDHGLFASCEGQQGAANGQDSWGFFQRCTGLRAAECWLGRRLHQLKASTTMDLCTTIFLFFMTSGLKKLGLVD